MLESKNEAQITLSDRGSRQSFRPARVSFYQRRYLLQFLTDFDPRVCLLRGLFLIVPEVRHSKFFDQVTLLCVDDLSNFSAIVSARAINKRVQSSLLTVQRKRMKE